MQQRIVIDARTGIGTGIGRYTVNLINQLQAIDTGNQYLVLLLKKDYDAWEPESPRVTKVLANYPFYGWQEQLLLPLLLWRLKPDLVHFTAFNVPLAYFRRYIVTIHDFTLVDFRNIHSNLKHRLAYPIKYWIMRLILRHAIMVSRAIVTPSDYVRQEIGKRYGKGRLAKTTTTLEAADALTDISATKPSFAPGSRFLLYVGNSYPHKNLGRLAEAFGALKTTDLSLLLVGQEDYFYQQLRKKTAGQKHIIMPGYASEAELVWLYQNAALVVFPSLSEGFGLPVLEAMTYGTPVICSNTTSLPEVGGDAVAYFDPTDATDMTDKIDLLLADEKELARLGRTGQQRSKQFSWQKMAQQTLSVYQTLLR